MESRTAALGWLENERPNVLACIRPANGFALHDLVIRLASAMAPFLRQAGPWDQAVGLHRTAAEASRHTGDQRALAAALAELGVARRFMASYSEATERSSDSTARPMPTSSLSTSVRTRSRGLSSGHRLSPPLLVEDEAVDVVRSPE
ncbi:hypothetical protein V7793_05575 [Streptomyces sp. KLMMK]|uniref:hypothetical protein n=1 Tax=Streptomyces sp. KLMMK TaxID=3109353 RepID=UPI003000D9F4